MPLPLEVAPLIDEFAVPGGLTIERRAPGTINDLGEAVPGALTTLVLDPCAVVPLTGRRLERAQSDRGREVLEVYCRAAIYSGDATRTADVAIWSGRRFVCLTAQDLSANGEVWIGTFELAEAVS